MINIAKNHGELMRASIKYGLIAMLAMFYISIAGRGSGGQQINELSRLRLDQFYHIESGRDARTRMLRYLVDQFTNRSKSDFLSSMKRLGYNCLEDNEPSLSQAHVTCSFRTAGTWVPLRWPEFWRIQAFFNAEERFERVLVGRFVESRF